MVTRKKVSIICHLLIACFTTSVIAMEIEIDDEHEEHSKEQKEFAFLRAAFEGDVSAVQDFLREGVDINVHDATNGKTALIYAVQEGHHDIVYLLLRRGAQVDAPDIDGFTALHAACAYNNVQAVQELLHYKADSTRETDEGPGPLHIASGSGAIESMKALIQAGAPINGKDSKYGYTPLHTAAIAGQLEAVRSLLANGANITITNGDNQTAYELAASVPGRKKITQLLLIADPASNEKNTAAAIATLLPEDRAITLDIMRHRINPKDATLHDARLLAALGDKTLLSSMHQKVAQESPLPAPLTEMVMDYDNPFVQPEKPAHQEQQKTVEEKAAADKKHSENATEKQFDAFIKASGEGNLEEVKKLMGTVEFDSHYAPLNNMTPLMYAAANGHEDVVQLLLSRGASATTTDDSDNTALHLAIRNGRVEVTELLLGYLKGQQQLQAVMKKKDIRTIKPKAHHAEIAELISAALLGD